MGITGCCNNRKIENFASTPRVFLFKYILDTGLLTLGPPASPSRGGPLRPRGPSTQVPPAGAPAARNDRRKIVREKRANRECRAEKCRQHQNESAALGSLAINTGTTTARHGLVFKVDFATAWRSKSFEEVPIKHGHANGGFTAQRPREIGC